MKKLTTADVIKVLDKAFARKVNQDQKSHEEKKDFIRNLCDAGLVDGVEPYGPKPIIGAKCLGCGKEIPGDDMDCPKCPMGTPIQMSTDYEA